MKTMPESQTLFNTVKQQPDPVQPATLAALRDIEYKSEPNEPLWEMANETFSILKTTGPLIFSDGAQYELYQSLLRVLVVIKSVSSHTFHLNSRAIHNQDSDNYNPLGRVTSLDPPTIESLAKLYGADTDAPRGNGQTAIAGPLASALTVTCNTHFRKKSPTEASLIRSFIYLNCFYNTNTLLTANTVTENLQQAFKEMSGIDVPETVSNSDRNVEVSTNVIEAHQET